MIIEWFSTLIVSVTPKHRLFTLELSSPLCSSKTTSLVSSLSGHTFREVCRYSSLLDDRNSASPRTLALACFPQVLQEHVSSVALSALLRVTDPECSVKSKAFNFFATFTSTPNWMEKLVTNGSRIREIVSRRLRKYDRFEFQMQADAPTAQLMRLSF